MPYCKKCGTSFGAKDSFCPDCGSKLTYKPKSISQKKVAGVSEKSEKRQVNWVLTLIMSVFFGHLGVDRFIMGHIGLGILKLLTLGGCGVWWLIDMILIATKHKFQDIEWADSKP